VTPPEIVDAPVPWWKPRRRRIEGVVLHAMGEFIVVGADVVTAQEFLARSPELANESLSAHRLVKPDGTIELLVDDENIAHHAGESRLGELIGLNATFLGIEFLLPGEWSYADFKRAMKRGSRSFTDEQYESGGWQCANWMLAHDFGRQRIVTHQAVAGDDVRGPGFGKLDPGVGFNHGRLTNVINAELEAAGQQA
jgi:N-acetyl-anhydromuramyl-L-alanine amidase AmpD